MKKNKLLIFGLLLTFVFTSNALAQRNPKKHLVGTSESTRQTGEHGISSEILPPPPPPPPAPLPTGTPALTPSHPASVPTGTPASTPTSPAPVSTTAPALTPTPPEPAAVSPTPVPAPSQVKASATLSEPTLKPQIAPRVSNDPLSRHKMRLHLDTRLLNFNHERQTDEDDNAEISNTVSFAIGRPTLALGFGYVIIPNLVLGCRLNLSTARTTDKYEGSLDSQSETVRVNVGFQLLPYVEYAFLTGKFRPFVLGTLGWKLKMNKREYSEDSTKAVSNYFVFGAGGGTHFFLTDSFSIDATGLLSIEPGKLKNEYVEEDEDAREYEDKLFEFNFAILAGISGWF